MESPHDKRANTRAILDVGERDAAELVVTTDDKIYSARLSDDNNQNDSK